MLRRGTAALAAARADGPGPAAVVADPPILPHTCLLTGSASRHPAMQLCDFNLSSLLDATRSHSSSVGGGMLNPRWLAPEVLSGGAATAASDTFAFGVVMVRCSRLQLAGTTCLRHCCVCCLACRWWRGSACHAPLHFTPRRDVMQHERFLPEPPSLPAVGAVDLAHSMGAGRQEPLPGKLRLLSCLRQWRASMLLHASDGGFTLSACLGFPPLPLQPATHRSAPVHPQPHSPCPTSPPLLPPPPPNSSSS